MRLLFLLVVALGWSATASAQQITVGGCTFVFDSIASVPDPKDEKKVLRVEYRGFDGQPVEAKCQDAQVFAQEMDYSEAENRLDLRGQVVFQQAGARITAATGSFDLKTRNAVFVQASGTLLLTDRQLDRTLFGSMEPEAFFTADRIEKTGPRTYKLVKPTFTTCVQPSRRWQIKAGSMTLTLDRYAVMRNAVLQVKDVSVAYLPLFYYPIQEDDRATGFLMPGYGASTYRGFTLSNAFFWAINRSADLTVYHDWFTKSGHGVGVDYRYVGHAGSAGNARIYAIDEKPLLSDDGSRVISPGKRSYEFRGNLNQALPAGIRLQGRANFFTDVTTQQFYQTDPSAFTQRSRSFGLDATGTWGRLRASAQAERNDVFYGAVAASTRTQPRLNLSITDAPIGRTKIYVGGSFDTLSVVRFTDVAKPNTRDSILRTDGQITARAPFALGTAFTVTGSLTARRTDWNARQDPVTRVRIDAPISRHLLEVQVRAVGPVFGRIYNTEGNAWVERVKHVIEPSVTVLRRSAFTAFDEVVPFDPAVDLIVGGVTQFTYGVTNRVLARVRQTDGAPAIVRDLLSLDIQQSYYTDQRAASYDQQHLGGLGDQSSQVPPPSNFTPVRLSLNVTPSPTISGQFGLEYDTRFRAVRSYRASANVTQPRVDFSGSWTKQQVIPGLAGYSAAYAPHSISFSSRVRPDGGRSSISYATILDIFNERMLQHHFGAVYNAQCCGISLDYLWRNLSHYGLRNDKRFSVSISLAGIGSFVNPLGVFGNNGRQ